MQDVDTLDGLCAIDRKDRGCLNPIHPETEFVLLIAYCPTKATLLTDLEISSNLFQAMMQQDEKGSVLALRK